MCAQVSSGATPTSTEESMSPIRIIHRSIGPVLLALLPLVLFVGTAAAADPGAAFCDSNMVETIKNIFTILQFGGPLIGGLAFIGAILAIPLTRRSDRKKQIKSVRNQGLLWGVIVAPLGTEIVQFILNNIVVGGTSCGF